MRLQLYVCYQAKLFLATVRSILHLKSAASCCFNVCYSTGALVSWAFWMAEFLIGNISVPGLCDYCVLQNNESLLLHGMSFCHNKFRW
jgi:hypothetical protein